MGIYLHIPSMWEPLSLARFPISVEIASGSWLPFDTHYDTGDRAAGVIRVVC